MIELNDVDRAMLLIKALANDASILYSEYTKQWYVQSGIEVSDGVMLTGTAVHSPSPALAVLALLDRLQAVEAPEKVVTRSSYDNRREYRWNGVAWAEV